MVQCHAHAQSLGTAIPEEKFTRSEPVAPWRKRERSNAPLSPRFKESKSKRRLQRARTCGSQARTALEPELTPGAECFSSSRSNLSKKSTRKAKLNGTPDACTSEPPQAARESFETSPTKARKQCVKQRSTHAQRRCSKPTSSQVVSCGTWGSGGKADVRGTSATGMPTGSGGCEGTEAISA